MIDYFALALTHGLLIIMLLRLVRRPDVDVEPPISEQEAEAEALAKPPEKCAAARRAAMRRRRNA